MTGGWVVVVPVKAAARGKSRLDVSGADRMSLARAIALDTIAAAAACTAVSRVVVVTDDGGLIMAATDMPGLRFVAETPTGEEALALAAATGMVPDGLNAAIARGMLTAEGMPRAALLGDLPALRPDDLRVALEAAAAVERGVVADAEGTGSTLVTASPGTPWQASFGDGSFSRHLALGCVALDVTEDSTLRRDVDTAEQLDAADALGLGPRTARLLAARAAARGR